MTADWQRGPLISFAELVSTGPFGSMLHKSDYVSAGVPLINPTNILDEAIAPDAEKQVSAEALPRLASYVLRAGDVVVGRRGEIGRCAVVGEAEAGWVCGTGCFFIRPLPSTDPRFLARLLRSPDYRGQLERASTGATMKNMSNATLAELPVALPAIEEQRRIVAILDEAFEGIATAKANAEKNLQNARELGNQLRNGLFTRIAESTKRRRLGDVCTFVRGPFGGSLKKDCFVDDGYAVYEQSHAIYDQFTEVRYFVSEAKFGEMRRFELRPNDLIMSCSGTMGRVAIAPPDLKRGIINQALLKLTPSDSVEALYLKHWMESRDFQDALAQCSGGAAIQNVASVSVLKEIALPLPSVPDQRMAVDQLERFAAEAESLHGYYERKILALDELKKSLLHQAFCGALTAKSIDRRIAEVA